MKVRDCVALETPSRLCGHAAPVLLHGRAAAAEVHRDLFVAPPSEVEPEHRHLTTAEIPSFAIDTEPRRPALRRLARHLGFIPEQWRGLPEWTSRPTLRHTSSKIGRDPSMALAQASAVLIGTFRNVDQRSSAEPRGALPSTDLNQPARFARSDAGSTAVAGTHQRASPGVSSIQK
jgi:hypothetical protein